MHDKISFIQTAIQQGEFAKIREEIIQLNVVDIAQLLDELEEEQTLILFRLLPKEISAEVFSYISTEQQQFIIESITDKEIKNIIDNLFMDDTVDILEEMPANVVKRILKQVSSERRNLINQFLRYPENSAGSLMTIEYIDLKKEMTVDQALKHIKKVGVDGETIDICYVMDQNRKLEGIIPLRKLILNDGDTVIEEIMETSIISINTHMDQEEISNLFRKYDLLAMPVVDQENRLVGIITIDDIIDIIELENTEDFHVMAAMEPSEEEYLKTSVARLARNRIVWLLILMVSATFTGGIIRKYDDILSSMVALAVYIPMLMDSAGNSGSQSATMIIRGLALGEVSMKDMAKVAWKELRVGLIVGLTLASVNFTRIYFFDGVGVWVAATVSISLLFTIILAKLVGGSLPIIAKKLRLDPAIMAGPLITTLVDAVALMIYFQLASWLLNL
ncbi:MAG: magnesium transporter [Caldicoprobacterales bacterium]|jgi:magnesium transporter|nr:magnesium transporter [Clostridiales bacterium]